MRAGGAGLEQEGGVQDTAVGIEGWGLGSGGWGRFGAGGWGLGVPSWEPESRIASHARVQ